jgi:hypothetical protein
VTIRLRNTRSIVSAWYALGGFKKSDNKSFRVIFIHPIVAVYFFIY